MGNDKTSRTEREQWIEERLFGLGDHFKTTISNNGHEVVERGRTAEEAVSRAAHHTARQHG